MRLKKSELFDALFAGRFPVRDIDLDALFTDFWPLMGVALDGDDRA